MPGTWVKIRVNCTKRLPIVISRCTEWADQGSRQCQSWADEGYNKCDRWEDEGHSECSSWGKECHWYTFWNCIVEWICHAWYWVAHWVCKAWYWVANWVCQAWYWVAKWVCTSWNLLFIWLCLNEANGGALFLLTDGTVLMNENNAGYGTRRWWKLTPDNTGSYVNGTWSRVADSINARQFFSSAVLADGRLLVCGGEYSDASGSNTQDETNLCEIYDPVANTWTSISPPTGWTQIGDGACSLLPDGRFFLGNLSDTRTAIFDPLVGTWTASASKNDRSSEETWILLPDNTIVTPQCSSHPSSEKYIIANGAWQNEGNLPGDLVEASSIEIGPGILLPDGRGFFVGATSATALYTMPNINTGQGTWVAGPNIPSVNKNNLGSKDGPGCLMVNGNILFPAAPVDGIKDNYNQPCSFFEFDGTNIITSTDVPNNVCPTFMGRLLLLPTGEIMWAREDGSAYYAFQYQGVPNNNWRPVISACPSSIMAGSTIQISGRQFNGLSQAVGYGDDYSAATNYPLVRIRNNATGHFRYCRTANHTTTDIAGNMIPSMGVATGNAIINTNVQIPTDLETGLSELFVVANGIASEPFVVTIFSRGQG
jgi:Kelch motif.